MPRRPTPSFDYEYLAGFQANEDNPYEVYYLSPASQKILSQLAEIVLWRDTRWYNGDDADIVNLSGQIYEELKVPYHFDDLLPLLDDVETLLAEIRDRPCCDDAAIDTLIEPVDGPGGILIYPTGGPGPLPIPDNDTSEGTGDYPITPATDPDEGGTVTHQNWLDYVCGAADWLIDSWIDWLNFTRFLIVMGNTTVRAIAWLVEQIAARILPGILDDLAVWTLPGLTEVISTHMQDLTTSQIDLAVQQLDAARDALKCALVGQGTASSAIAAILGVLSGEITNASIYAILASPVASIASMIWNGAIDVAWDDGCGCQTEVVTGAGIRMRLNSWTGTNIGGETTGGQVQIRVGGGGSWFAFHSASEVGSVAGEYDLIWTRATSQAALDLHEDDYENPNFLSGQLMEIRLVNTSGVVRNVGVSATLLSVWDGTSWRPIIGTDIISGNNLSGTLFVVPAQNISGAGAVGYTSFNVRGLVT